MKLQNLDSAVINFLSGKPFSHDDEDLSIRRALVLAVLAPTEEKESDEKKFTKYQLATKLQRDKEPELDTKQIADIRTGSAAIWSTPVHGALVEYLEGQASK